MNKKPNSKRKKKSGAQSPDTVKFRKREFRGSRFRCLLATSQPRARVASFINSLTPDEITVTENHRWAPQGFTAPDEAKLAETRGFLSDANRETLESWWLANPGRANTPNWDLVSTCNFGADEGLILVEAKAHWGEFTNKKDFCGAGPENLASIQHALAEANVAWNELLPGFNLSEASKYQLSNRFAFAWKLASLGVPVVLIYLGFLNAEEMTGKLLLTSHEDWETCVKSGGESRVPITAWNRKFEISGTPLWTVIRSADVGVYVNGSMEEAT